MNNIGQKTLDELEYGDIISTEPTIDETIAADKEKLKEHVVNFITICPNQNLSPTGDIHCFGCKHWRHIPRHGKVYYFGKSDDERFWSKERKRDESRKLFNSIAERFDITSRTKLRGAYYVKLFGKRGVYDELDERLYLPDCYNVVKEIAAKLEKNQSNVVSVKVERDDDIETSYSRAYETECYGSRHSFIEITFADGEVYHTYM